MYVVFDPLIQSVNSHALKAARYSAHSYALLSSHGNWEARLYKFSESLVIHFPRPRCQLEDCWRDTSGRSVRAK